MSGGLLHLAADIEGRVELVRLAERGGLDFVTVEDAFALRAAAGTSRIGVVPVFPEADGGRTVVGLDVLSHSRAGARSCDDMVRVVDATEPETRVVAARHADVALVRVASPAQAAVVRRELRARAVEFGRDPDAVRVLAGLLVDLGDGEYAAEPGHGGGGPRPTVRGPFYRGGPVDLAELITGWHKEGAVDGFHFTPVEPRRDLERLVNGTVALLQHRGLFRTFYPGGTLREHLGLGLAQHRGEGMIT